MLRHKGRPVALLMLRRQRIATFIGNNMAWVPHQP
jgi:hypothetical protein